MTQNEKQWESSKDTKTIFQFTRIRNPFPSQEKLAKSKNNIFFLVNYFINPFTKWLKGTVAIVDSYGKMYDIYQKDVSFKSNFTVTDEEFQTLSTDEKVKVYKDSIVDTINSLYTDVLHDVIVNMAWAYWFENIEDVHVVVDSEMYAEEHVKNGIMTFNANEYMWDNQMLGHIPQVEDLVITLQKPIDNIEPFILSFDGGKQKEYGLKGMIDVFAVGEQWQIIWGWEINMPNPWDKRLYTQIAHFSEHLSIKDYNQRLIDNKNVHKEEYFMNDIETLGKLDIRQKIIAAIMMYIDVLKPHNLIIQTLEGEDVTAINDKTDEEIDGLAKIYTIKWKTLEERNKMLAEAFAPIEFEQYLSRPMTDNEKRDFIEILEDEDADTSFITTEMD